MSMRTYLSQGRLLFITNVYTLTTYSSLQDAKQQHLHGVSNGVTLCTLKEGYNKRRTEKIYGV